MGRFNVKKTMGKMGGYAVTFWEHFFNSWNSSNVVSGIMALTMTGLIVYLAVTPTLGIPEAVAFSYGAIITYFFVDKQAKAVARREDEIVARDAKIQH